MFSSNQILEVTGCLSHDKELYNALRFALLFADELKCFERNDKPSKCVYQITSDGRYCLGWAFERVEEGWNEFPFDFDLDIIAKIIEKHLEKQKILYGGWDGSYNKGFRMKAIEESMGDEDNGVINPFYGIVEFSPYTCFYSK